MSKMTKAEEQLARAHNRDLKHKHEMKVLEGALVRKALVTTNAGMLGAMDRLGVPKSVKGFPWKLGLWVGATIMEAVTKGMLQQASAGVSDSTLAIYTHGAIAGGSLVAGEGDGGEV
jgi:hypothetical protein